jgi:ketosteroid isomerase-like protein
MSEENAERTRLMFDAFNRRDLEAMLDLMDDAVEAHSRLAVMEGGYRGHEGIRRSWKNLTDVFPDFLFEVVDVRDFGDVSLATLRNRAHGTSSDAPLEEINWFATRWRLGKCVWWSSHGTEAAALEAAGLARK